MRLSEWLRATGTKRNAFAARIGVAPSYITMLCQGTNLPSLRLLQSIVRETEGEVSADDFWREDNKPRDSASPNTSVSLTSLDAWMTARGVSDKVLADQIGRDPQTISRLRRGRHFASPETARRIEAATHGDVTQAHLLGRAPAREERAA
jgi:DNA-binding transcriptional regulator YdaS (Cro superfamily)